MHDQTSKYFDATQYARRVLGNDAEQYFPHLHQLSRHNSLDELLATIDGWRPATPAPVPTPTSAPESPRWTPCRHFGGDRLCKRCVTENTRAGIIYAGAMAKADAMFKEHRAFVQYRIKAELFPWTNGPDHPEFDDIEQKVWQTVAARIATYEDTGTPMAWLKVVVHSAVIDYIRRTFAGKRGATVTGPLDFDPASEPLLARPIHPAGATPAVDGDSLSAYVRSETVGRKSTKD